MVGRNERQQPEDERRTKSSDAKLRSKLISDDVEQQLTAVTGLTKSDMFNRRGGIAERGLAALLEPGDRIVEILPDHVVIETKDGTRQTFWNMKRELPFLVRAPGAVDSPDEDLGGDDGQEGGGS